MRFTRKMSFDFETYSEADLKEVGVSVYARHPSTVVLMVAWSFDKGRTVHYWDCYMGTPFPQEVIDALLDPECEKSAWNASFEQNIVRHVLDIEVVFEDWTDPMILARHLSLPGRLAEVCPVLGVHEDLWKHATGKALINFFCKPRKATKTDKSPFNEPTKNAKCREKWETFGEYNRQDVRAECAAYERMVKYDMPDWEWDLWTLDRVINERGVPINRKAVSNIQNLVSSLTDDRLSKMREITGLKNPNSGEQLLDWLKGEGYPFNDLKVGHVRRAFKEAKETESYSYDYEDVLEARLEVSKASIKKYAAYEAMTNDDGFLRNMLVFNGAGRTCRWAGSGVMLHNLARPGKDYETLEAQEKLARDLGRMSVSMFDFKYGKGAFEALSSGTRGVVHAGDGNVFVSADFNAIENRVLGWMTGDRKILRVFELDRCPYVDFATYMFGGSYEALFSEYKGGNKTKRTTAKPGVLGCFGPDTPVLTDRGWVRIVEVTKDDRVHDGVEFVRHGGVAFRGFQKVLSGFGIHATPDHDFLVNESWVSKCQLEKEPNKFRQALATANGLLSSSSERREAQERFIGVDACAGSSEIFRGRTSRGGSRQNARDALRRNVEATWGNESALNSSTASRIVSMLRARGARTRGTPVFRTTGGVEFVCGSRIVTSGSVTLSMFSEGTEPWRLIGGTTTDTMNPETFASRPGASNARISDTWDVINSGPRNRFVVLSSEGPLVAHNCGYMLGEGHEYEDSATGEILATGLLGYAWNMGITSFTQEQASLSVKVWRDTFEDAVQFWYDIDKAIRRVIRTGRPEEVGPFDIFIDGDFMKIRLPSGRYLHYLRPRIEQCKTPWGEVRPTPTVEGYDNKNGNRKVWGRVPYHPGKWTENLDQAIARELLAVAIRRAMRRGLDVRLHVHDEIIALSSEKEAERNARILSECMTEPIKWAKGLPLKAEPDISKIFAKV